MIDLRQGDCLKLMKDIPDKSIDMILCDLPYGATACKWDTVIPFEPFSSKLRMSNLKMYKYDWIWNKVKPTGHLNSKKIPLKQHEIISVFYKGGCNYYPIMTEQPPRISKNYLSNKSKLFGTEREVKNIISKKYPKTIIEFSNANQTKKLHPTQKPVALLEYLIKTYTNENETVLDNCMGSGSTGVACINTNRNFIGIELDEKYYKIACERINNTQEKVS